MAKGGGHGSGQKMRFRVIRSFDGEKPFRAAHWTYGAAEADLRQTLIAMNNRGGRRLEASIVDAFSDETLYEPKKCVVCDEAWATESSATHPDEWRTCADCEGADELDDTDQDVLTPDLPYTPPAMPAGNSGEILIAGACGMGKTSQRAVAALAERYAGPGAELRLVEPKPDTIESALMNLPAGDANGVNVAQALEPAVAIFTPRNALPHADPSALLAALDRRKLPRAVWADGTVAAVANGMLWRMQAEPHAATGEPCGVWSVMSPVGVRGHFVAERAARFIADRRVP